MLNPLWLKTFIVLIDTNHFTKTAEKLYMTQSGVSQHIKKLESACGYALIEREKKSFVITEQGRLVYHYAKNLAKFEGALIEQLGHDAQFSGQCSIACSGTVASILYPKLIALQCKYPDLIIKLKAAPNHEILADIKSGRTDIGIVTEVSNPNLYEIKALGSEDLCLIVPKGADETEHRESLLKTLGLIAHPDAEHYLSLYFSQSTDEALKQIDIRDIPVVGSINQMSQILEPIAQGVGFTVLPRSGLESFYNKAQVKVIKPKSPIVESLYSVKQKNRRLPARYNEINDVLSQLW